MRQVADLVGAVFADELDPNGRSMLQEMQSVGRFSTLLSGLMSASFLGDFVSGFVWIEGERVLGNVTLQRVDAVGVRWRISNVAVVPEHRGRGIARALMLSSLAAIAQHGGAWAVLQVRVDNPPARRLYESLGFTAVCQEGIWRLPKLPDRLAEPAADIPLVPLSPRAWRSRFELARAGQTPLAQWLAPIESDQYRVGLLRSWGEAIGNWTGLDQVQRWGVQENGLLSGLVETSANTLGGSPHRLRLLVLPEARGRLEKALVCQGLRTLARMPPAPVVAEHSGDHVEGVAALESAGFRPQRVLLTMRRPVMPADALL
jgi:GNAT superfamily N-acetyltransferase